MTRIRQYAAHSHNTQHYDNEHNDIHHSDTQHNDISIMTLDKKCILETLSITAQVPLC